MSLKPPGSRANDALKSGSSFLKMENSVRSGATATTKASNFSKLVSGRAGQSTRGIGKGDKSSGSGRRSRKKKKDDTARVIVDGRDVTPLPLISSNAGIGFQQAFAQQTSTAADASQDEHGGSLAHGGMSTVSDGEQQFGLNEGNILDSDRDWAGGLAARLGMQFEYATDGTAAAAPKPKEWTDKELREKITIKIEETDTITLLHIPGIKIWSEDETEAAKSEAANKAYQQCLEKHKEKDKYSSRSVQTFNNTQREKEIQVSPPQTRSAGCDVSTWDIYDVAMRLESQVAAAGPGGGNIPRIQHESDLIARTSTVSSTNGANANAVGEGRGEDEEEESAMIRGEDATGMDAGPHYSASNTPSVHSAQQSFHGSLASGASFRGKSLATAATADRSWHANLSTGGASQSGLNSTQQIGAAGASGTGVGSSVFDPSKTGAGGGNAANPGAAPSRPAINPQWERLLSKSAVAKKLRALEQAVVQSSLHEAQLLYRNHPEADVKALRSSGPKYELENLEQESMGSSLLPPLSSLSSLGSSEKSAAAAAAAAAAEAAAAASNPSLSQISPAGVSASMVPLWSFSCPLTQGMNVSCMVWNKQNLDLIAAGYGSVDFGHNNRDKNGNLMNGIEVPRLPKEGSRSGASRSGGLILFWSLKNPRFPQKIFHTRFGVTSLDFSEEHPHLLAAGLYDGSVAVYDIRDTNSKPALESQHNTGKHSEPVWGVKFVAKELNKRSQQLTSISTDGSVKQWSMKKGLVPHELMQLKRIPNRAQLQGTTMEGLSREASGMCFDFPINDGTQYFAGTEDGLIHKCSVSYNEQTLENFFGHTGPVYKVRCSPFFSDAFLSCSADWSAMLWSQKMANKPVLKFASGGQDYVMDIVWSPNNSCMFGLVSRDGRVEIWDLDVSPLDPIIKYQMNATNVIEDANAANSEAVANAGESGLGNSLLQPLGSPALSTGSVSGSPNASASHPRQLSCISFSANAPVVLVGTSDGSIDLFRLEGTALTSSPPTHADKHLSYGQEINAYTVNQVPRDRERDIHTSDGMSSAQKVSAHEDASAALLEKHAENLTKFKEQAKKLEALMDQHNDSKNKLAATNAAEANASPVVNVVSATNGK